MIDNYYKSFLMQSLTKPLQLIYQIATVSFLKDNAQVIT